jgi:membrane protease YdiL (CAAX protease family)
MTLLVEGALFLLAGALMWATGVRPEMSVEPSDLALGLVAGATLAFIAVTLTRLPWRVFAQLQRDIDQVLGLFRHVPTVDLVVIAVLAGVCEEMFFRGWLQTWLQGPLGGHVAVLVAALVFGLMHAISRSYVVFAFGLGVILGYLYWLTGSLPATMLAHASYDLAALIYGTKVLASPRT